MKEKIFQNADLLYASTAHPMLLLSHFHIRGNFVLYRCKILIIDGNSKHFDRLGEAEGVGNMKLEQIRDIYVLRWMVLKNGTGSEWVTLSY